ncbi:MAG: DedA family protein [Syntrophomonas sp.]|nr:DedA family protein [Syntrophomonas sp.]
MDLSISFTLLDILINLDKYLNLIFNNYGTWAYLILFLVIFCETGLVVTPFLPGDSLIFVLGALAASGEINLLVIVSILMSAAILGNIVNYQIGRFLGPKVFSGKKIRFLKTEYLVRTHEFYEKHGGKTIIIARFIPIIRTFAPFVAGIGHMSYPRFLFFNIIGCVGWVALFLAGGYAFGNIPAVQRNFTLVVFGIIFISLLPAIIAFLRERQRTTNNGAEG